MIKFQSVANGETLGTFDHDRDGGLTYSSPSIQQIVEGTRRAYLLTDAEVYEYFAKGSFDNGYVRATVML